jgi:acyl-CoA reductase-like NAD-dependent aldehyde dehydrogenase
MSLAARSTLRTASRVLRASPLVVASSSSGSSSAGRAFTTSARLHAAPAQVWKVDNPYTGETVAEIPTLTESQASKLIDSSSTAFQSWKSSTLAQRIQLLEAWCTAFAAEKEALALSITQQMGKPLGQARGEVDTAIKRARALIALAPEALQEEVVAPAGDVNPALLRKITKEPIGVVLALCPWNYPLLCAVNTVVAATLAGNSVLIKHSDRTPLCADVFERTFAKAGAPKALVQAFHADHALTAKVLDNPKIAYVQFTGSVAGGRAVYSTIAKTRFIDVGLELGGKDPAYVAADADLPYAIENVVDGAMYNAGQSCCAVERVYVHASKYDAFLDGAAKLLNNYVLGDPTASTTSMGPIAQPQHGAFLASQIAEAKKAGARILAGGEQTKDKAGKGRFFQPTLIADAGQALRVMSEESFGPIMAVQRVKDDAEAVKLMNDSVYGLTASVWTADLDRANTLARQLDAGTVFMNRCDFLDPYLAWSGRKDSGKGIGLSQFGFQPFYRTKSYNFRPATK